MRFLVDECCGPVLARWLQAKGHDVRRVAEIDPGMDDVDVLQQAFRDERVLITSDKDFGARVFERGEPHEGVILLRLADERPQVALQVLAAVLETFGDGLHGKFVVATERHIRPDKRQTGTTPHVPEGDVR
jgi:predicted nuclease of predicted toxin-antitoxin system